MRIAVVFLLGFLAAACTTIPQSMTRTEAIALCQEKAREAAGPTGKATVGANSNTGPFFGLQLSFSDAFIRGLNPDVVFENCMNDLAAKGVISEGPQI